jgi:hypothetical protein
MTTGRINQVASEDKTWANKITTDPKPEAKEERLREVPQHLFSEITDIKVEH